MVRHTLDDVRTPCAKDFCDRPQATALEFHQSNIEGELVNLVQDRGTKKAWPS